MSRTARVKARYPAAEPLPPSRAPKLLKRAAWVMLLLIYCSLLATLVVQ